MSAPLDRLRAMDAGEAAFRARCELRKAADRVRWHVSRERWQREAFVDIIRAPAPLVDEARRAARRHEWKEAHLAFASYLSTRPTRFPLDPGGLPSLTDRIRYGFPGGPRAAAARATSILDGQYDLLGYRQLSVGSPPDWHRDPVHGREASQGFWADVRYLDRASGDHKIIWELNRHQHWLALARAYHLTGERRFYAEVPRQLASWLESNPPLSGSNWASMLELAFRSLSWIWILHLLTPAAAGTDPSPWSVDLLVALDRQLTHIEHNLSRYFSPNTHLSGEALALYVSGAALPELTASSRRLALGREVLLREAERQVNADGGHAELSAHYHRYSTDFYLMAFLVATSAGDAAAPALERAARLQARYLRAVADDRGRLPLVGDDDGGQLFPIAGRAPADCRDTLATAAAILDDGSLAIGALPEETYWLCGSILPLEHVRITPGHQSSVALPASGYYVSRRDPGEYLLFDAGRHGFLNGGHAHADALSIVLTTGRRPLLVDPGTATYTMDPEARDRFRSSAMHNTVTIGGRGQAEPHGPFHWRSRTDARAARWHSEPRYDFAEGRHRAYAPVVHARAVLAVHGVGWFIIDHLVGGVAADAESYWHLHPDWQVLDHAGGCVTLEHRDGVRQRLASTAPLAPLTGERGARLGEYAPEYGRVVPGTCLTSTMSGRLPCSVLTVIPAAAGPDDDLLAEAVPIERPAGHGWHAAAFRVRIGDRLAIVMAATPTREDDDGSDPPGWWGTGDHSTSARAAFVLMQGRAMLAVLQVGGALASSMQVKTTASHGPATDELLT